MAFAIDSVFLSLAITNFRRSGSSLSTDIKCLLAAWFSHCLLMAAVSAPVHDNYAESDYGSDFSPEEESIVLQLLDNLNNAETRTVSDGRASFVPVGSLVVSNQQTDNDSANNVENPGNAEPERGSAAYGHARTPAASRRAKSDIDETVRLQSLPLDGIRYPDLSRSLAAIEPEGSNTPKDAPPSRSKLPDTRSPLERFRTFPKKPLTVTDISSGAWCELQYWYTLSLLPYGKKKPTAAMRGGTKVHKKLEDQVHTTVEVSIATKEEAFALKLWNVVQGLRTLRDTGLTRELEVWGIVDGQVINGVIDEASYTSPDVIFDQELSQNQSRPDEKADSTSKQPSISNCFDPHHRRVYLMDVKTRGVNNLPSGVAVRPGKVQLTLYHRLLAEMASGQVNFPAILERYGLKPEARFSDAFMAQIGSLHQEVFDESSPEPVDGRYPDSSPNMDPPMSPAPKLIRYRSIQQIIPLLQSELRDTFPRGESSVGAVVSIQYRHRSDGHIIGHQCFPVEAAALNDYLQSNLAWWHGRREAEGVPIEEAYKCGYCEFAENCSWRKDEARKIAAEAKRQAVKSAHV